MAVNLVVLKDGKNSFERTSVLTRADVAGIEIAHHTVEPGFSLTPDLAGTTTLIDVQAAKYLEAVDEYGSPAYTPAELAAAPDYGRRQADVVLPHALPLSTFTRLGRFNPRDAGENCIALPAAKPPGPRRPRPRRCRSRQA